MKKENDYFIEDLQKELESKENVLVKAYQAQVLSAKVGFEFDSIDDVFEKVKEEFEEIEEAFHEREKDREHFIEEIGDGFFALINLARFAGVTPTELVYATTKKYLGRMAFIEEALKRDGVNWQDRSLEELDLLWDEAKASNL
jgi:tetrapyrrole methylase family protein/MazG family protein